VISTSLEEKSDLCMNHTPTIHSLDPSPELEWLWTSLEKIEEEPAEESCIQ
jgi:hypothetical protein